MPYRRGFRSEAESLATDLRAEIHVRNIDAIDVLALASHLEVPVRPISWLRQLDTGEIAEAVDVLRGPECSAFSAMTVFFGPRRVVVHNDAHVEVRQSSNIAHELAHAVLLHTATPAIDDRGCRNWNGDIEAEASFLGGAILLPKVSCYWIVKRGIALDEAARRFCISTEMVQWRLNMTGAERLRRAG